MKKKKSMPQNPACSVKGCRAKRPHTDDPLVSALFERYNGPDKLLGWVHVSIAQIHDSILDDYRNGRHFGWITRLRQIEELYYRALYMTFFVADADIPHWLAGDPPNSLTSIYNEVNREIFGGGGGLTNATLDGGPGNLTPMGMLHSGGHAGFRTMQHVLAFELTGVIPNIEPYLQHVKKYVDRVDYMRRLFEAGRDKQIVIQVIKNMHTPLEEFQKRVPQREAL